MLCYVDDDFLIEISWNKRRIIASLSGSCLRRRK